MMPLLRLPEPSDSEALFPLIFKTTVTDTIAWDGPGSAKEFRDRWREIVSEVNAGSKHFFTIIDPVSTSPAGACDVRLPNDFRGEVGLWIGLPYQRNGIGTKVVRALTEYGFGVLAREKIEAHVFVGNVASRRIFERNGFTLEGTIRAAVRKRGVLIDKWCFGKLRSEHAPATSG